MDVGVWTKSKLKQVVTNGELNIPEAAALRGFSSKGTFVIVTDDAFPESHFFPGLVWEEVALSKLARPDKVETGPDTFIIINMLDQRPQQRNLVSNLGFVEF
ncbi:hypothetical protein TNCV_4963871 [Trichonephila clavipes]|nr:hypothetical protein TNCV_4963871 [Trichonephila clavipes]